MDQRAPVSVVFFSHLGYDRDQISEVTYHSVSKLADSGLLQAVYVLDAEPDVDLNRELIKTPIPGKKMIPRGIYFLDNLSPFNLLDSRNIVSTFFDRVVARNLDAERIVYVFPEFQHTAARAARDQLTTVVYARGCHPNKVFQLFKEEQAEFANDIRVPHDWFNRYQRTYDHADYVFYLCDYVKETLLEQGFPEERLFKVGPLTVDPDIYHPASSETDEFVVLAVSHMTPLKGTKYLLDAWEMLDIDNARLVLCGGMSDDVRAELGERVDRDASIDHLGHVDDIAEQYRQASVFVHPSLTEGFPKVYAEAMASEVPVIATENGPTEFIDDAGLVVPIRDPEAIAEKLRYLHDNPDEAQRMGKRGRAFVQENPWEEFSKRVLEGHRSVLESIDDQ
jgi:glycosyltransferase involved in cell wall biosynthesis